MMWVTRAGQSDSLFTLGIILPDRKWMGEAAIVKARTLLLMCGLSLAGAATADPIGVPRPGPDRWIFGRPNEGYDLRRGMPHTSAPRPRQDAATIPLPRPRPNMLETTGRIQVDALNPAAPVPPTAPISQPAPSASLEATAAMPQPIPLVAPESQSDTPPASAPLSMTQHDEPGEPHRQTYTAETPRWAAVVEGLACDQFRKEADGAWVLVADVIVRPYQFTLRNPKLAPTTEEAKQLVERCGAAQEVKSPTPALQGMSAVNSAPKPQQRSQPVKDSGGAVMPPVAPLE